MTIDREYYRFTDSELIEKRYGITEGDLIYLGEEGKLPYYVIPGDLFGRWYDEGTGRFIAMENMVNKGPQLLLEYQAKEVLREKEISFFQRDSNKPGDTPWDHKNGEFWIHRFEFAPRTFSKNNLVIMATDLQSLKTKTETLVFADDTNSILKGQEEIMGFLSWSWNYCKDYMKEEGIYGPPEGERKWKLPIEIARKIREKHPSKKKK